MRGLSLTVLLNSLTSLLPLPPGFAILDYVASTSQFCLFLSSRSSYKPRCGCRGAAGRLPWERGRLRLAAEFSGA